MPKRARPEANYQVNLDMRFLVDTYLCPGKAVDPQPKQVLPAVSGTAMYRKALHINPDCRLEYSKTGELDESLLISRR